MKFYTYAHYTADTNEIFYIGKGCGRRLNNTKSRSVWWKRKVDKHGFTAKILAYWKTEKEALDHEEFLISCFTTLVNLKRGGDCNSGYCLTNETKAKLSAVKKGKPWSENRKKACVYIAPSEKQLSALSAGRSAENMKKARETQIGRKRTEEEKQKRLAGLKNKKKVYCTTSKTVFNSINEAVRLTGVSRSGILRVCTGKLAETKGLTFMFVEK